MCKVVNYTQLSAQDLQCVYIPQGFSNDGMKQCQYADMQFEVLGMLSQMLNIPQQENKEDM